MNRDGGRRTGDAPSPSRDWWPDRGLFSSALANGWRPTPFREFVLKVHQRCNLACDYCYMYTKADQSWRRRPAAMTPDVYRATARRIAEHVRRHGLSRVRVVLHGGEPLLLGARKIVEIAATVRSELPSGCDVRVAIQTNGVKLDRDTLDAFVQHAIRVGVSLDGRPTDNDRHRRTVNGHGSGTSVERALDLLSGDHRRSFSGILCTIDLRTAPVDCYEYLLRWQPPVVDFLLPHANWLDPPPMPNDRVVGSFAEWLIAVFDRWYGVRRQETRVRLLEEIINLVLGGASRTEHVGLSPLAVAIVESDGDIELVDALKSAYAGATSTGLNVLTDSFDAAFAHPGVVGRQVGIEALSAECRRCPVHRVCGAGNYAHRYSADGFKNPTVYCGDMRRLIEHVHRRVSSDLAVRRIPPT